MEKVFCSFVLRLLFFAFLTSSCSSLKQIDKQTEKVSENTEKSDKNSTTEVNKAIEELIKIKIAQSNTSDKNIDSIVNARVDEILSKINFNKVSGANGFEINYDKLTREIIAKVNVGQTENISQSNISEKTQTVFIKEIKDVYKRLGFSWYWYLIIFVLLFWKWIWKILKILFPFLSVLESILPKLSINANNTGSINQNNDLANAINSQNIVIKNLIEVIKNNNPK